ncbi:acyl-ACP--UDP-N-acetylglucosamine O-acyltransferase [Lutibaculum baratangense]|uniref:Acyl-[acyl-carrier-protein]--UDP-N-acetylglucosamine O-acyltransferase n=1 Tax=Lutibaculum baratangense AMV1 TaxID=631454 RepID=V4TAL5_9HYPH|nr:acyl-ACP--UDP-N-acetylglucosamine O-acyltransferase [Lutibaculum baratangense]ESR23473.1 Acyl-[acyl-carrier-protein]--UDP-N- acetylglucosamine O-acyltransferase [Lutibaculum baratangense AMV1]
MTTEISIHPTAIVASGAVLGEGVKIGPYCVVGENVVLGDEVDLVAHVTLDGHTSIGARTKVFPFASLGHPPQHLRYAGETSRLIIGDDCTIREQVTMNPGTAGGGMETRVGDNCFFMVGSHVAHDCHVGNNVIFTNCATIGGHCQVGDRAILGGLAAVHQWCRIGESAFVGGMSAVQADVIPYGSVLGNRAYLGGLNIVGLKRQGFAREEIHRLRQAYRLLFSNEGTLMERVEDVGELFPNDKLVQKVVTFIRDGSDRSMVVPASARAA